MDWVLYEDVESGKVYMETNEMAVSLCNNCWKYETVKNVENTMDKRDFVTFCFDERETLCHTRNQNWRTHQTFF